MSAKVSLTLKTIIAEDEQIVRQSLKRVLSNEKDIEIVDECANGSDALASIEWHEPDLLLLDVGMPGMGGFDVLKALGRRRLPLVVLITAFDKYAIRAFEASAVDYLLKPSSPERIRNMLVRVREQIALIRRSPKEEEDERVTSKRFSVRSGQRTTFVTPGQIDWVEASGNYAILHVGDENHFLRESMTRLCQELPQSDFIRVSRSAIVRVDRVRAIHTLGSGRHSLILKNGRAISVVRGIRELEARLRGH